MGAVRRQVTHSTICRPWTFPCYFRILRHASVAKNNREKSELCICHWYENHTSAFESSNRCRRMIYVAGAALVFSNSVYWPQKQAMKKKLLLKIQLIIVGWFIIIISPIRRAQFYLSKTNIAEASLFDYVFHSSADTHCWQCAWAKEWIT